MSFASGSQISAIWRPWNPRFGEVQQSSASTLVMARLDEPTAAMDGHEAPS